MISVSNIERFATHDGPGIRTTVFLQGCSLHCPWCANPETWTIQPVLMHDEKKCVHCHICEKGCPKQAISFHPSFSWDISKCGECHACVSNCMSAALNFSGKVMSINEILEEVLKDKEYYDASSGGITISGGEPFVQFESFLELIQACKEKGLHVAVETTGNYPLEKVKEAMPYIDLFLFDIKHLDKEKLWNVTGGYLNRILGNLRYITSINSKKVILRTPVIPGFNYDLESLTSIIQLAKELDVLEINLLPYHSLGKSKWEKLHKEYAYEGLSMMDKKELSEYKKIAESMDVSVKIGG